MQQLFDVMCSRLCNSLQKKLRQEVSQQQHSNPNDRLQQATLKILSQESRKDENTSKEEDILTLASLLSYLTPSMQASDQIRLILKQVNHPYIDIFLAFFEDKPSNYKNALLKMEKAESVIRLRSDYTDEMKAHVKNIQAWMYGQQGKIATLKDIYSYGKNRLPQTKNLVEQLGLQNALLNIVWWLLHSGIEPINELEFLEPYVKEYHLYQPLHSYLNIKGTVVSYFGDNKGGLICFEELFRLHEKYNDNYRLSIALGNASESYFVIGHVNKAKDMLERAIKLYHESTGGWPYLYLVDMGNIYFLLGELEKAEESFLKSYEIQKNEKSMHLSYILFELVHFYLRRENLIEAKKYLKDLRELDLELPIVNAQMEYLRGFYELLTNNLSNAEKYLQKALKFSQLVKKNELVLFTNIQLVAVYLKLYRLMERQDYLNQALNFTDNLIQLALEYQHLQILVSGYKIRSVLNTINGEFELASNDLERSKKASTNVDFDKLKLNFEEIEESIIEAKKTKRVDLNNQKYFNYILPQFTSLLSLKLPQRASKGDDKRIMGLLIIGISGKPIMTRIKKILKVNEILLSGMLTVIDQIASTIIEGKERGRLKEINYEDFCITLQASQDKLVAVITKEVTASVRIWTSSVVKTIDDISHKDPRKMNLELKVALKELLEQKNL